MPWPANLQSVYQIQDGDLVDGGTPSQDPLTGVRFGVANLPPEQLTARTDYLLQQVESGAHVGPVGSLMHLLAGQTPVAAGYVLANGQQLAPGTYDPALGLPVAPKGIVWEPTTPPISIPAGGIRRWGMARSGATVVVLRNTATALQVLLSLDAGSTWQAIDLITTNTVYGASIVHSGTKFFVCASVLGGQGTTGYVWTSTAGQTWAAATAPSPFMQYAMAAEGDRAASRTEQGDIYVTADAGATWYRASQSVAANFAVIRLGGFWHIFSANGSIRITSDSAVVEDVSIPFNPRWAGLDPSGRLVLVATQGVWRGADAHSLVQVSTKGTTQVGSVPPRHWGVMTTAGLALAGMDQMFWVASTDTWSAVQHAGVADDREMAADGADLVRWPSMAVAPAGLAAGAVEVAIGPGSPTGAASVPALSSPYPGFNVWMRVK